MGMILYSFLLALALAVSAPWWLWRMATSGRYRTGLAGRIGRVPEHLSAAAAGRKVIWLHAVSVGEVLAATQLIAELQAELPDWVIAVSTTTAAGYKLANERLPSSPVFFLPLDFKRPVRAYLDALKPRLVVLMESELWPRMLVECERTGIPVAVANARISDRSYPRYKALRLLWKPLLNKVSLFLAQGDESADRLAQLGVATRRIRVVGNLKYDAAPPASGELIPLLRSNLPSDAEFLICGSTLDGEEKAILVAWERLLRTGHRAILLIAPRHPQRFDSVVRLTGPNAIRLSQWQLAARPLATGDILILDSIGQLAAIYKLATVAFIGGSIVRRGGHNPLEPARFGVPIVMGPHYQNFREMVDAMRAREAIDIVEDDNLTLALHQALQPGHATGKRALAFYEEQTGATARSLIALKDLLGTEEMA
jgi:3-deoxy-D-manno-octulosonic-acid transferase